MPSVWPKRTSDLIETVQAFVRTAENRSRARTMRAVEVLLSIRGISAEIRHEGRLPQLRPVRRNQRKATVESHKVFQNLRTMLALVDMQSPPPRVMLGAPSYRARNMVRALEKLARFQQRTEGWDDASHDALFWAFVYGVGWLGSRWDPNLGDPIGVPTGEMVMESVPVEQGDSPYADRHVAGYQNELTEDRLVEKVKWTAQGRGVFWAPCPMHVFGQQVSTFSEMKYLTVRTYLHEDEGVAQFGSKFRKISAEVLDSEVPVLDAILEYQIPVNDYGRSQTGKYKGMRRLLHHFVVRDKNHPEGIHAVIGGDVMLAKSGLEVPNMLPIAPIKDFPTPGTQLGDGSAYRGLSVERTLNQLETDMAEARTLGLRPPIFCEHGTFPHPHDVTMFQGKFVPINRGVRIPEPMDMSGIPYWTPAERNYLNSTLDEAMGVHSSTRGDTRQLNSGRQQLAVMAADKAKWSPMIKQVAAAMGHAQTHALRLYARYGPLDKLVKVVGPYGGMAEVVAIARRDIPDDVEVYVDAARLPWRNPEVQHQKMLELLQTGAFPDRKTFWKAQENSEVGRLTGNEEPSRASARQAIVRTLQGQPILPPLPHEDHMVWLDEFEEFMRDPEFYDLPQQLQLIFVQTYMQRMALAQMPIGGANPVWAGKSQMPQLPVDNAPQVPASSAPGMPPTMQGRMPGRQGLSNREAAGGLG